MILLRNGQTNNTDHFCLIMNYKKNYVNSNYYIYYLKKKKTKHDLKYHDKKFLFYPVRTHFLANFPCANLRIFKGFEFEKENKNTHYTSLS